MADLRLNLRRYVPQALRRINDATDALMTGVVEETPEAPEILDKSLLNAAEALEEAAHQLRSRVAHMQAVEAIGKASR